MPRWLRKQKFVQSKLISDNCRLQQSMMRHSAGSKVVNYTGLCTRNKCFEIQPKKNGGGMYPQDGFKKISKTQSQQNVVPKADLVIDDDPGVVLEI